MEEENIEKKDSEENIEVQEISSENKSPDSFKEQSIQKNKKAKEGSFTPLIVIMGLSLIIAFYWDKLPWIGSSVDYVLNPTAGAFLKWNLEVGMLVIVFLITFITTIVQKYATDQETLKELKREQKEIQKQMKELKNHPEKMMELQKKRFTMFPKQMKLSMRGIIYTGIPFILFFRWFQDFFGALGEVKFFGIIGSWFLFYFIFAIIFGSFLRKWLDVV